MAPQTRTSAAIPKSSTATKRETRRSDGRLQSWYSINASDIDEAINVSSSTMATGM
jgi:hypothetical protein